MKSSSIRSTNDTTNYKTKKNKVIEVEEAGQCSSSPDSSFRNKKTLHRSLSRAENHLPKSPHKKAQDIEKLVENCESSLHYET